MIGVGLRRLIDSGESVGTTTLDVARGGVLDAAVVVAVLVASSLDRTLLSWARAPLKNCEKAPLVSSSEAFSASGAGAGVCANDKSQTSAIPPVTTHAPKKATVSFVDLDCWRRLSSRDIYYI